MKIHSSCEIEDFVETHLCKLCVILGIYMMYHSVRRYMDRLGILLVINPFCDFRGK